MEKRVKDDMDLYRKMIDMWMSTKGIEMVDPGRVIKIESGVELDKRDEDPLVRRGREERRVYIMNKVMRVLVDVWWLMMAGLFGVMLVGFAFGWMWLAVIMLKCFLVGFAVGAVVHVVDVVRK